MSEKFIRWPFTSFFVFCFPLSLDSFLRVFSTKYTKQIKKKLNKKRLPFQTASLSFYQRCRLENEPEAKTNRTRTLEAIS